MPKAKRAATGEELHELFHSVFVLQGVLSAVMDDVHARVGMRTSQCKIADALERHGPAAVPQVAAWLGVSRQFVQTVCNEMEALGLLEFRDSPRHKRSRLASLTEKGKRVAARAGNAEAAIIERTLPDIDAGRVADASGILRAITDRIPGRNPG